MISKPLEEAVSSINGVRTVQSSSQEGVSVVALEFFVGTDLDAAGNEIRSRLDAARAGLPREAQAPVLYKASVSSIPVLILGLSGSRPADEVRQLAEDVIKDRLAKVTGVASVSIVGGQQREVEVEVDKARLQAYGLSIGQVAQALTLENLNLPSGGIREGRQEYAVRTVGEFERLEASPILLFKERVLQIVQPLLDILQSGIQFVESQTDPLERLLDRIRFIKRAKDIEQFLSPSRNGAASGKAILVTLIQASTTNSVLFDPQAFPAPAPSSARSSGSDNYR